MSDIIVAGEQLRQPIERIERIEADIADLNADKSEVYKEARGCGFDVKAMRKVVSKRKLDTDDREEQDAIFETCWNAVHGIVHAHTREKIEEFDPETGEVFEHPHRLKTTRGDESGTLKGSVEVHGQAAGRYPESRADKVKAPAGWEAGRSSLANGPCDAATERPAQSATIPADKGEATGYAESFPTNSPETANEAPKQVYGDSVDWATALPSESVDIPAGGGTSLEIDGSMDACPAETHSPEGKTSPKVLDGRSVAETESRHQFSRPQQDAGGDILPVAPAINERCEKPSQCKFSHHPQKITCAACGAAWAAKAKVAA